MRLCFSLLKHLFVYLFQQAMVKGAISKLEDVEENVAKVVLLAVNGTMCRRNTLPRLHRNGIVVMRVTSDSDDGSSSSD